MGEAALEEKVESFDNLRLVRQEGKLINANWPFIWAGVEASVPDLYKSEAAQRALFCDLLRGTKLCYFFVGDQGGGTKVLGSLVLEPLMDVVTRKSSLNIWSIYASTIVAKSVYTEAVEAMQRLAKDLGFTKLLGIIDTRFDLGKAVFQAAKAIPGTVVKMLVEIPAKGIEED